MGAANEGISEQDNLELNAMLRKLQKNFRKSTPTATMRPQGTPTATGYISRAGRQVPSTTVGVPLPNTAVSKENVNKSSKDCEDAESIKGRFGWEMIGKYYVPYIMRIINGECVKFVSVRMAETQLLTGYLRCSHADIYTSCTSVQSHFILESEATLLNGINCRHCDQVYGKQQFLAGKDYIVRLEDVTEFYLFIEVCSKKLLGNIAPSHKEKCGFIRINSESVVPYCLKDDQKYVPLFFFESKTENLRRRAVKLENWNLAYLKFCFKVQGLRKELFASDSCIVISLDNIKSYFPPDTNFEEYWPAKVFDTQLLNNQKTLHANSPASWIKAPPSELVLNNAPASEGIIPHSMPASTPVPSSSVISVTNNSNQNGLPSSSMGPAILQQQSSSSMNSVGHIPPPPLVRIGNNPGTTPIVNNAAPYPNVVSLNQPMTTTYNTMTSNAMTNPSQLRQYYSNQRSNNVNQPQPQQMIATLQTQQSYSNHSIPINGPNVRMNVTQPRNALRNITTGPPIEIIDLSSPSSSPPQQAPVVPVVRHNVKWVLNKIPERTWTQDSSDNAAYKMHRASLQGRIIHGINSQPFVYLNLMVTLEEFIQTLLPPCTVARCAYLIQTCLNTPLYSGNSEQIMVLRENRRLRSMNPDDTPLVMLHDATQVMSQLNSMITKNDEQIHVFSSSAAIPSKRQRMIYEWAGQGGSRPDWPKPDTSGGMIINYGGSAGASDLYLNATDSNDWLNAAAGASNSPQQLLHSTYQNLSNPPASWIKAPPSELVLNNAPAYKGIIPHSMPASTPVPSSSVISVTNNSYQNGLPSSPMGPAILQQQSSSSMNSVGHIPPPPLVRIGNNPGTTPIVNNAAPYPNAMSLNQPMTTMYNTMTSNAMTNPSQLRQYYSNQRSNNVNQPQPQQMMAILQTQQSYSNHSIPLNGPNVRMNVTQPRNALRNITTGPPIEIIDLSPPSSPPPQQAPVVWLNAAAGASNSTQQLLHSTYQILSKPPASWIKAPPSELVLNNAPASEGIIPHSMPASTPVPSSSVISVTNNSYQNGLPSSPMVNSDNIQAQPQPTRRYSAVPRNQNVAAQYSGPAILQQQSSSSMNSVVHIPPPPLVRTGNNPGTTPIVNNAAPYPNVVSLNQPMTTMYNTMTSNVMTNPSQLRQYYSNQRSNNVNQPQPQLMMAILQTQPTYSNHPIPLNGPNVRMNVTQPRNALRNITTGPPIEIIDLSPPSSPPPQQAPVVPVVRHNVNWVLTKIPERRRTHDSPNNGAYQMQNATFQGKIITGINSQPFVYLNLMVTLEDLIQTSLPPCTVARCAYLIQTCLNTPLYSGNSEQIMVLRENGRLRSTNPDDTPLIMLQDATQVLRQLKSMITKNDEQIHMFSSSAAIPSKRQRMI